MQKEGEVKNQVLKDLSIIIPWTTNILNIIQYIEVGGSLYAMDPCVYCITQSIVYNESIPLGIIITTSESEELFDMFIRHVISISHQQI